VARGEVDLRVRRQVRAVRDAAAVGQRLVRAQSRAHDHVRAEARALQQIGRAGRARDALLVIQVDVVVLDVGQVVGAEVELRRVDVLAARALERDVAVDREVACT
jgi:hypothetical protein